MSQNFLIKIFVCSLLMMPTFSIANNDEYYLCLHAYSRGNISTGDATFSKLSISELTPEEVDRLILTRYRAYKKNNELDKARKIKDSLFNNERMHTLLLLEDAKQFFENNDYFASEELLNTIINSANDIDLVEMAHEQLQENYWSSSFYKDNDYVSFVQFSRENGMLIDNKTVDYRLGLITLRKECDLSKSKDFFVNSINSTQPSVVDSSRVMLEVISILDACVNSPLEEINSIVDNFVTKTQGVDNIQINPVVAGFYLYRGANCLSEADAAKVHFALYSNPIFGKYSVLSGKDYLEFTGSDELPLLDFEKEIEAYTEYEDAMLSHKSGDYENVILKLHNILEEYSDCMVVYDSRLRLGYVSLAKGDKENAIEYFEEALRQNAALGYSHPFQKEALFRLKQINHSKLYESEDPFFDNASQPSNYEKLIYLSEIINELGQNSSEDSADYWTFQLEYSGLLFEQATNSASQINWIDVNEFINQCLEDSDCPVEIRAVLELMEMETFFRRGDYSSAIRMSNNLVEKYRNKNRIRGTAYSFMLYSYIFLEGHDSENAKLCASEIMQIPAKSEMFSSLNYHTIAARYLAHHAELINDKARFEQLKEFAIQTYPEDPYNNTQGRWIWKSSGT